MKGTQHNPRPMLGVAQMLALMVVAAIVFSIIITVITILRINQLPFAVARFSLQRSLSLRNLHCGMLWFSVSRKLC